MTTTYTEIPHNWHDIEKLVESDSKSIPNEIIRSEKLFFYDACSFIRHSNLCEDKAKFFTDYFTKYDGCIIVTRCILMELASHSGNLNDEYIRYFRCLHSAGLKVIILNEEDLFGILSECYSTSQKINEYLSWAVKIMKSPVSTICETLKSDEILHDELLCGKNLNKSDIYTRFFKSVRSNKEASDNLGEELIGICLNILSHVPGVKDGKLCVMTDDKGAAGKIGSIRRKENINYSGAKIIVYSTPKLVQHMYQENMELRQEDITEILSQGTGRNIVVMGTTAYDLEVNDKISMTCEELAEKIMEPNGINIVF